MATIVIIKPKPLSAGPSGQGRPCCVPVCAASISLTFGPLESYQIGGEFTATQFYADIEGHPEDKNVALALEELEFFSTEVHILGVYPQAQSR